MFKNIKILTKLILNGLMVFVFLSVLAIFVLSSIMYLQKTTTAHRNRTQQVSAALFHVMSAEIAFKTQGMEWKNILIKGDSPEIYLKYFRQFEQSESEVLGEVNQFNRISGELELDKERTLGKELQEDLADLGKQYRKALESFKPGESGNTARLDLLVTGADQDITQKLGTLVMMMKAHIDSSIEEEQTSSSRTLLRVIGITASISLVCVFLVLLMAVLIGRDIATSIRRVSGLSVELAKGDLRGRFDSSHKDEIGSMSLSLNEFLDRLTTIILGIRTSLAETDRRSRELIRSNDISGRETALIHQAISNVSEFIDLL